MLPPPPPIVMMMVASSSSWFIFGFWFEAGSYYVLAQVALDSRQSSHLSLPSARKQEPLQQEAGCSRFAYFSKSLLYSCTETWEGPSGTRGSLLLPAHAEFITGVKCSSGDMWC